MALRSAPPSTHIALPRRTLIRRARTRRHPCARGPAPPKVRASGKARAVPRAPYNLPPRHALNTPTLRPHTRIPPCSHQAQTTSTNLMESDQEFVEVMVTRGILVAVAVLAVRAYRVP